MRPGPEERLSAGLPPVPRRPDMGNGSVLVQAGFWRRVGAMLIDLLLAGWWGTAFQAAYRRGLPDPRILGPFTVSAALVAILVWAYFVVATGAVGATFGKLVFRLRVVSTDFRRPDWSTVLFREVVGRIIVTATAFLGYLWVLVDPRKQGWHDKVADTYVVKKVAVVFQHDPWDKTAEQRPALPAP